MKKTILFLIISFIFSQYLFADYDTKMKQGDSAYKQGDFEKSLEFYESALIEKPNDTLSDFVEKIKKEVAQRKKLQMVDSSEAFGKTLLIGMDVVLTGFAVMFYIDYNSSVEAYDRLYNEIDGTTADNKQILIYESSQVEQKGVFMGFVVGAAGVAIAYTLVDMFLLNNSFGDVVTAEVDFQREYAGLKTAWRF